MKREKEISIKELLILHKEFARIRDKAGDAARQEKTKYKKSFFEGKEYAYQHCAAIVEKLLLTKGIVIV